MHGELLSGGLWRLRHRGAMTLLDVLWRGTAVQRYNSAYGRTAIRESLGARWKNNDMKR